jgi:hypothetical protein
VEHGDEADLGPEGPGNGGDPAQGLGRAWAWRRRMEAGEFTTVNDLAKAVGLAERHVSRQLRLAYLASNVLRRLTCGRESPAVSLMALVDIAAQPWACQEPAVFP